MDSQIKILELGLDFDLGDEEKQAIFFNVYLHKETKRLLLC